MEFIKKFFKIYGQLLLLFKRLQNFFPKVRNVTCKNHHKLNNLTFQFYAISFLLWVKECFPILTKIINFSMRYFNTEIHKAKIDFYMDDNYHSIILVKGKTLNEVVSTFYNFMKDYIDNRSDIIYDNYCCKISNILIKSNGKLLKEFSFDFIKEIVSRFRGVDSEFNKFCIKRKEYGISNKLIDVLELYGCEHKIDLVEVTKIPPTIKKVFSKEHLEKLELDQIDY